MAEKEGYEIKCVCFGDHAKEDIIDGLIRKRKHIDTTIDILKEKATDELTISIFKDWIKDINNLIDYVKKIPECEV